MKPGGLVKDEPKYMELCYRMNDELVEFLRIRCCHQRTCCGQASAKTAQLTSGKTSSEQVRVIFVSQPLVVLGE